MFLLLPYSSSFPNCPLLFFVFFFRSPSTAARVTCRSHPVSDKTQPKSPTLFASPLYFTSSCLLLLRSISIREPQLPHPSSADSEALAVGGPSQTQARPEPKPLDPIRMKKIHLPDVGCNRTSFGRFATKSIGLWW